MPHALGKIAAVNVVGNDIRNAVIGRSDIVNGDDRRVLQLGKRSCFFEVTFETVFRCDAVKVRNLDGDLTMELAVERLKDAPVSSFAEQLHDLIPADLRRQHRVPAQITGGVVASDVFGLVQRRIFRRWQQRVERELSQRRVGTLIHGPQMPLSWAQNRDSGALRARISGTSITERHTCDQVFFR